MQGLPEVPSKVEITQLLKAWGSGDDAALVQLTPIVENELHRLAHRCMTKENPGHTLQTTALVNEVYLECFGSKTLIEPGGLQILENATERSQS